MNTTPLLSASRRAPGEGHLRLGWLLLPALLLSSPLPLPAQDTPPPALPETETFSPPEYSIDRYQKLRGKSPFEFELAKPPPDNTTDPFADFVLAGFAGSGSRVTVYLLNTKTQERTTVLAEGSQGTNKSGFRALGIKRGRTLSSTTALLEKDGVQKELAFDPKALSSMSGGAVGGAVAAAPGGRPGMPGQPIGRPANIPARPAQAYQAPQAFIPGQANRNPAQANFGAQAQAQAQGQATGMQPGLQPGTAPGVNNPQQQVNTLLNNPNPVQAAPMQPNIAVPTNPGGQPGPAGNPQPRRRVVLPTPSP